MLRPMASDDRRYFDEIQVGEAYESKASALNGVESVKKNAVDATVVDQTAS